MFLLSNTITCVSVVSILCCLPEKQKDVIKFQQKFRRHRQKCQNSKKDFHREAAKISSRGSKKKLRERKFVASSPLCNDFLKGQPQRSAHEILAAAEVQNEWRTTPLSSCPPLAYYMSTLYYFTSSKSTIIHYQCVSTGCCVHVARIKISIDNQHVTKPMQRYDILPEQPKEKA